MAILIVGLLGVAGWSVYAGRKIVGELALSQQAAALDHTYLRPDEPVPAASAALDPSWKEAAQKLEQRLRRLEQAQSMPQSVAREASSSVALVVGEYIWTDRMGRKPLRYAGLDESGTALRDSGGREIVSFDAEGPIVVREFTGTAFLPASGEVLTSDFILRPWDADPLLDQDQPELVPSIRLLHAYFPGSPAAGGLKIEHPDGTTGTGLSPDMRSGPPAAGLELSQR